MAAITRIQARRGTSAAWSAANPVLADGETGWDTTAKRGKVGDGTTAWAALAWVDAAVDTKVDEAFVNGAVSIRAPKLNPIFSGTVTGVTKGHVGLGNVDNTNDASKPVSNAQQAALNGKADTVHTHSFADVAVTELGAGINLNDLTPGDFFQSQTNETGWDLNYPLTTAGWVQHRQNAGMAYQYYTTYGNNSRQFWRTRYNGTWYAWQELSTGAVSNVLGTAENPVTSATAARPTGMTTVWWTTATQPTNWANGDIWVVVP